MYKKKIIIFFVTIVSMTLFGQSLQDLKKMKSEYEKMQKDQNLLQLQVDQNEKTNIGTDAAKLVELYPYSLQLSKKDSIKSIDKFFGYDFLIKRDTIPFWENLPTPANYLLGAGDELIISLWGETQLRESYTISRDGKIYDEKVGLLYLSGKTIIEGKKYLKNQFGRVYATLNGPNPSTFIDISLGEIKSINITFVGEVSFPGIHPVHPFSNVITSLIQAGGIDTTGSLRNIQIKREGKIFASIDLYEYFLKGDIPKDIQLRDQDIIFVPLRYSTITIDSAIIRPGYFEAKPQETIKQMIDYAGGLKSNSSSSIAIKRIIPIDKRIPNKPSIENFYIDYNATNNTHVENGDIITVHSIFDTESYVEILGQVKKPGQYHYYKGMKLKELIKLGAGFNDSTYRKSAFLLQGDLVRRNPKNRYETVIPINIEDIITDSNSIDIELNNLDRFVIRSNYNFFKKQNIQIFGEVNIPGSYPLISDNESLKSIISRSGGLTENALVDGISIYRKKEFVEKGMEKTDDETITSTTMDFSINKNNKKNENKWIRVAWNNDKVTLMPGDSITIRRAPGTIFVSGEVYNPGLIEFEKGKSLKYYIDTAGGETNDGDKNNVIVIYANGLVKPKKFLNSPRIRDGATIIVNRKKPREDYNLYEFATNALSLISTTVTILVLSKQASSG